MKKIILSLGLAAATFIGVQAQETPQPQEQPQETPQEQPQEYPQEQPQQEQPQQEQPQQDPQYDQQQQQQQQDIEGEGIEQIETSQIPQEVNDGMQNSEYQNATVEQAYKLSGTALTQILGQESLSTYSTNTTPETLYLLRVTHEDSHSALYFTEDGELYASEDMDM